MTNRSKPVSDLPFAAIDGIARLFRKRKLSPVELTKLLLDRIERLNPKLNAYLTVTVELAFQQAKRAETELFATRGRKRDRGPLHGIPISLKDNIYTAGIRTTAGSKILRDFLPLHNAAVVSKLQEAGAVLLGKTNMHEFAYGITSNNPHYGPVRNPWDTERISGGSSGGSAAAVAAGLCYASIGTDTGGSIRVPSALCGVVGLKPGAGRVSAEDVIPLSQTLDFVGPIARTVRDTAIVLDAIWTRGKGEAPAEAACKPQTKKQKWTLGLPSEFFFDIATDEIRRAFNDAISRFSELGVTAKPISIPLLNETENAGNWIAWAEATHYHTGAGWFPVRADEYGKDVRTRLEMGVNVTALEYLQALEQREKFIQQLHLVMEDAGVDAFAVPTTPIPAPLITDEAIMISKQIQPVRAILLRNNRPANLAGVPAITVPCGFTPPCKGSPSGLPVGLQLVSAVTDESVLLRLASIFEKSQEPWHSPVLE